MENYLMNVNKKLKYIYHKIGMLVNKTDYLSKQQ